MKDLKKFLKLVRKSHNYKKQGQSLLQEDPQSYNQLLNFLVVMESNLHWENKTNYIKLIENFLNHQLKADDFSIIFCNKYEKVNREVKQLNHELDSLKISKLLITNEKSYDFSKKLTELYSLCDNFDLFQVSRIKKKNQINSFHHDVKKIAQNL